MLIDIHKMDLNVKGIIHIGAYIGEEVPKYLQMGVRNILLIEPLSRHCEKIKELWYNIPLIQCAVGNYDGYTEVNISETQSDGRPWFRRGDGASSSILVPEKHLTQHPNITFSQKENVPIFKLNTIVKKHGIQINTFNMLNIDVQGYELEVLKGATDILSSIDYVLTEVNCDEVYQNCAKVEEIDEFLSQYQLKRIETDWAGGIWGDALYVKDNR